MDFYGILNSDNKIIKETVLCENCKTTDTIREVTKDITEILKGLTSPWHSDLGYFNENVKCVKCGEESTNLTLEDIKTQVDNGKKVYLENKNYAVIKDTLGKYLIHSRCNDSYVGLHGLKNTKFENKCNMKLNKVFIEEE
jgi:predicted nucleic-acid-binding Zn-ribbon protein